MYIKQKSYGILTKFYLHTQTCNLCKSNYVTDMNLAFLFLRILVVAKKAGNY